MFYFQINAGAQSTHGFSKIQSQLSLQSEAIPEQFGDCFALLYSGSLQ